MLSKIDIAVRNILCCPLCKGQLDETESQFACITCGITYPRITVGKTSRSDSVFDFRIHWPKFCKPLNMERWSEIQNDYEKSDIRRKRKDKLEKFIEEIDSLKEVYTEEFNITKSVLDVGGHQGKLRHFLSDSDVPLYVSVDPLAESFADIDPHSNLIKAYLGLLEPCNFLSCHAEHLPFQSNTFDWVHMRSVLDHFYDPYRAIVEAYRVLKDGGMILIGLAVTGGKSTLKNDRPEKPTYISPVVPKVLRFLKSIGMIKAVKYELKVFSAKPLDDGHMCRWQFEDLQGLLKRMNFEIAKVHWQKKPYEDCVYIAARKKTLESENKK